MGSYINLGFISTDGKPTFLYQCEALLHSFKEVQIVAAHYPADESYSNWIVQHTPQMGMTELLTLCAKDCMSRIHCSMEMGAYAVRDVRIQIKPVQIDTFCLLLEMPEANPIFHEIDMAECIILAKIKDALSLGFSCAFCDSEADAPRSLAYSDCEAQYSIFARSEPSTLITRNSWKIDGLSLAEPYENRAIDFAIAEAEREFARNGELCDARTELGALRKKYLE